MDLYPSRRALGCSGGYENGCPGHETLAALLTLVQTGGEACQRTDLIAGLTSTTALLTVA